MKTPAPSFGRAFAVALASVSILAAHIPASAATLTWDPAQTPATPSGGAGTWDTSSLFWSNGTTDVAWTNSILNDTALFAGTADLVTLGSDVSALGLQFSSGYALIGTSIITLGTGGIVTDASSGLVRIQNSGGITLGAAQSWNAGSSSALSVSGPVINGGFLLTTTGAGNTNLTGIVSGTGGLTKTGSGTLTLSAVNTFSGGLTISSGVVSVTANNLLGGATGTAGAITLDGGTLRMAAPTGSVTNTHVITVGSNGGTLNSQNGTGTYILGNANNLLGSGALTISGTGSLVTTGAGVVVFGNANTYNGIVTIQDGGIAEYANAGGVATGGSFIVGNNGNLSITGVTNARDVTLNAGSTLSFQNANTGIYSGNIALAGDTTIGLRDWYNYATVRSGTISSTITGARTITVNSGTNLGTGGTLTLGGFDAKASSADLVMNGASLAIDSGSGTAAASVTRANSLTINTGNLNVTGVASQATNDVFGTLNLGGGTGGSTGTLQGYSTWTLTPNAATNAALTFTNMGTRTAGSWVALAGTFGGTPAANMGNIYFTNGLSGSNLIGSGGTLASGTASVIPWLRAPNSTTIYGYDATVGIAPITMANVDINSATAGQNVLDNTNGTTLSADRTVNSLSVGDNGGGNYNLGTFTLTVSSGVIMAGTSPNFNGGTLNFGSAEAQLSALQVRELRINSSISGSGGLTFVGYRTNSGNAGRLILSGANTYTGVSNFYNYGNGTAEVRLTNSLALQNTTVNHVARGYNLIFGNGGTTGQTAYTFGGLSGNANINLNNNNTTVGAVALTIGGNNENTTYSGVLSSTVAGGSLTKTGTGTLTLSGANTFTGATTVSNGTLALASTGSLASTSYVIGNGATFNASAKSTYSLASAATTFDVGATTAGYFNAGTADLTLGNTLTLNFLTASIADGQAYNLFDLGTQTGDFSSVTLTGSLVGSLLLTSTDTWTNTLGGYDLTFNEATGNLLVNVSAVPEPATYAALAGLGVLAVAAYRRRRNA